MQSVVGVNQEYESLAPVGLDIGVEGFKLSFY